MKKLTYGEFKELKQLEKIDFINNLLELEGYTKLKEVAGYFNINPKTFSNILRTNAISFNKNLKKAEIKEIKTSVKTKDIINKLETLEKRIKKLEEKDIFLNPTQTEKESILIKTTDTVVKTFRVDKEVFDMLKELTADDGKYAGEKLQDLLNTAVRIGLSNLM